MDTSPLSTTRLQQSVIAVPPLARDLQGHVSPTENAKIIRHIERGGVSILLYGGNAVLYHVRLSEYSTILQMLSDSASDSTTVIPSVGPAFGMMMDQAAILKDFDFPTAMILPQRDITDPIGIVRGIRAFVDVYEKPIVLYLKFPHWLPTDAIQSLVDEGSVSWIKYAVVQPNPAIDDELQRLVDAVPPALIVSGIGEQPAIIHRQRFGVSGFTSGCVCVAPARSMELLKAMQNEQWLLADSIRGKFSLLEDLRNAIHPIRVLHAALETAGIAQTGPIPPLLSELSSDQLTRISAAAISLRDWDQSLPSDR